MARGIDTPDVTTHKAAQIKDRGFAFVVRYYRSSTSHFTPLTRSEVQALKAADLYIVTVYEGASDHKSYFSPAQGKQDARQAHQQAMAAGQPSGTPIYFAVDYDAAESHLSHNILPYFQAVKSTLDNLGGEYEIGVYGSGLTCRWLRDHTD